MVTPLSKALELLNASNTKFDLTNDTHQKRLLLLADELFQLKDLTIDNYKSMVARLEPPLEFQLAVKLVESRRMILRVEEPTKVGVVFATVSYTHLTLPTT